MRAAIAAMQAMAFEFEEDARLLARERSKLLDEIAALEAERDRLTIIADAIQAERDRLRAALEEITHHPRHYYDDGDSDTAQAMREIARRALDGEE
jgi:hypothetical protein